MPSCAVKFDTLEDVWQWYVWLSVSMCIYLTCTLFWNRKTYGLMRGSSRGVLIYEWFYRVVQLVVIVSASYAAWRVYECGNWDVHPLRLFYYILWLVFAVLLIPMMFLFKNYTLNTIWHLIIVGLSVTVTVFFFITDVYAGVVFMLICLWYIFHSITHMYIWANRIEFKKKYKKLEHRYADVQRPLPYSASAEESVEKQTTSQDDITSYQEPSSVYGSDYKDPDALPVLNNDANIRNADSSYTGGEFTMIVPLHENGSL